MTAVFSLRDVTLGYDRHPAVHHLTGSFATGSLTAVVGPNGSGKSTLLKGLIGHLAPLDGRLERNGLRQSDIAYLPQQAEIDRSFPITVMDTVLLGHWRTIGLFRPVTRAQRRQADEALQAVGLDGFGRRPIVSLSAGQFQRVLFARMLLQNCPVILLDEPFTAIDAKTSADLLRVVVRWPRRRADGCGGAARPRPSPREFPGHPGDGPRARCLGGDRKRAAGRASLPSATDGGAVG